MLPDQGKTSFLSHWPVQVTKFENKRKKIYPLSKWTAMKTTMAE